MALPIAVITLTGMALGFRDVLVKSEFPYKLEPKTQNFTLSTPKIQNGDGSSVERALTKIQSQYPALSLKTVNLPINTEQSLRSVWKFNSNTHMNAGTSGSSEERIFFSNPETGEIIADADTSYAQFFDWVLKIHRGTIAGLTGKASISILGLLLFVLWPTGIWIRLRKTKSQRQPLFVKGMRKRPLTYHRSAGMLGGFLISFMGLSGSLMNFNFKLIQTFDPLPPQKPQFATRLDLKTGIQIASHARPNSKLQSIHFSDKPQAEVLYYFSDNSRVYLNSDLTSSPEPIIKIMNPKSSWIHSLYPLHSGRFFGIFHPITSLIIGSLLLGLIVSGFYRTRKPYRIPKFLTVQLRHPSLRADV